LFTIGDLLKYMIVRRLLQEPLLKSFPSNQELQASEADGLIITPDGVEFRSKSKPFKSITSLVVVQTKWQSRWDNSKEKRARFDREAAEEAVQPMYYYYLLHMYVS